MGEEKLKDRGAGTLTTAVRAQCPAGRVGSIDVATTGGRVLGSAGLIGMAQVVVDPERAAGPTGDLQAFGPDVALLDGPYACPEGTMANGYADR